MSIEIKDERIKVKKLPFGDATDEGRFYVQVDGENIGEDGRAFWKTESEAYAIGSRYLMRVLNLA